MKNRIEIPKSKKDIAKMFADFTDQQIFEFCEYGLKRGLYLQTEDQYNDELEKRLRNKFGSNMVFIRC